MKLTPGQIREILSISQETFRHWKGTLPPLAGRNGYTRCFSHGDLFALSVIKILTEDVGIRVGLLRALSSELFAHFDHASWTNLERSTLIIEPKRYLLNVVPESGLRPLDGVAIVLPCRAIITQLRQSLLMEQEEPKQASLRFPPTAVTRGADAS